MPGGTARLGHSGLGHPEQISYRSEPVRGSRRWLAGEERDLLVATQGREHLDEFVVPPPAVKHDVVVDPLEPAQQFGHPGTQVVPCRLDLVGWNIWASGAPLE